MLRNPVSNQKIVTNKNKEWKPDWMKTSENYCTSMEWYHNVLLKLVTWFVLLKDKFVLISWKN